jgi:chromosome segregation ATPase
MNELPAEIQDLKRRFEALNERKYKTEVQLQDRSKALEELKKTARDTFGTDDPEKLQALLQKQEAENLAMRKDYEALLNRIETELQEIDNEYRETP